MVSIGARLAPLFVLAAIACDAGPTVIDAAPIDAADPDAADPDAADPDAAPIDAADPDAADPDAAPIDAPTIDAPTIDAPTVDAAPIDAATDAPPGDGCPTPPAGDWIGTASERGGGAGETILMSAEVQWTRVATVACVDRYEPSGLATYHHSGHGCDGEEIITPATVPISAGDGSLTIDRTAVPATYQMQGYTTWQASEYCSVDPPSPPHTVGGLWADASGSFDGQLFAGGPYPSSLPNRRLWRFARVGAVFTPPTAGCSEPAAAQWMTTTRFDNGAATATWTRVSTTGCVDTFHPAGVARFVAEPTAQCTTITYEPSSAPIQPDDGVLTIDRSTDPATFVIQAGTAWSYQRRCTRPDGSVAIYDGNFGTPWASAAAAFDGDRFGGAYIQHSEPTSWSFTRL